MKTTVRSLYSSLLLCGLLAWNPSGQAATCSHTITIPSNWSLIANHCDHPNGNTLNNVLAGVPECSQLVKWNKQTQSWDPIAIYKSGTWTPNYTLHPGEGAFFCNPGAPFTHTFTGNPHPPVLPLILPTNGYCIASRQTPGIGTWDSIVGSPPQDGDIVFKWDPVTQSYLPAYTYIAGIGWIDGLGQPAEPQANVGESIWICRGAAGGGNIQPPEKLPCEPGCLLVTNEVVRCVTNGVYTYSFSVINQFREPVYWLTLIDLPPGVTVNGQPFGNMFYLDPPLATGDGTNFTVTLGYSGPPTNLCFRFTLHNDFFAECCAVEHCLRLDECCALIFNECVQTKTNAAGDLTYSYSFSFQNLSTSAVYYVFLVPHPPTNNCFTINPPFLYIPGGLPPGGVLQTNVEIIPSGDCGPTICLLVALHDARFNECCSVQHCLTLPSCCRDKTYTLDADFALGTLVNLNYTNVHNQLQLTPVACPPPYVYIACSQRGTAVRIDVNTGTVLGEYLTSPNGMGRNPSRTTVDKYGNCWVANRDEFGLLAGQPKGSVVRIGLIIGGTRCDANGNPNPLGQYLKPPFTYSTCADRDGDGLIKTSRGLGDILSWSNAGSADSAGGVSTAEDECITVYTRVNGAGTRFLAIDCDNNVWTGGLNDADFQKLDGFTGLPLPAFDFNIGCGGYGGLIDGYGTLWSSYNLMRYVPSTSSGACPPISGYGMGIDPRNCHIFLSSGWAQNGNQTGLLELDSAGNVVNAYPAISYGMGLCVDAKGHVWVAQGTQVAHLAPSGPGHILVGYVGGMSHVRGVAVDCNGKVWAADLSGNSAHRIDPLAGPIGGGGNPIGAIDLTVPLGAGAGPYNYSDMTGFVELAATCRSGFWDVIHDGCAPGNDWGIISWNSQEPTNTSITVDIRADDLPGNLPAKPFKRVKNGERFCERGITGRYLEIRVNFTGAPCSTNGPVLYDLTIGCCRKADPCDDRTNRPPSVAKCPDPILLCDATNATSVTVNVTVTDPDGDPLVVTWREGNNPPFEIDNVPAGGPPTTATVGFTRTFAPGQHVVIMAIDDGSGPRDLCDIIIQIGDKVPPVIKCPPGVTVAGFQGAIPDMHPIALSDNCTPSDQIVVVQSPLPGTVVGPGTTTITLTATDAAGNVSSCQTFLKVTPNVRITSPVNYSVLVAPATVVLLATVDAGGSPVQSVRFHQNGQAIGSATNAPYRVPTAPLPAGFYNFRAVATDPQGRSAESDAVQVIVQAEAGPGGPAPLALFREDDSVVLVMDTDDGVECHVEYTESLSSSDWKTLRTLTGDGTQVQIRDSITNAPNRFYRVRME
jgi:hypothetical protein